MIIAATRYGSVGGSSKLPNYTYTGLAPIECKAETGDDWELVFQRPVNAPSGPTTTITFTNKDVEVEIFVVGGGQAGSVGEDAYMSADGTNYLAYGGAGGNGGETVTATKQLTRDTEYSVSVGGPGMSTSFTDGTPQNAVTARSSAEIGAAGGVGARTRDTARNGGDGADGNYAFNQLTTDGLIYSPTTKYGAGGGGGSAGAATIEKTAGAGGTTGGGAGGGISGTHSVGADGLANTGAGGGGGSAFAYAYGNERVLAGGLGGSGIVIIRNVRT